MNRVVLELCVCMYGVEAAKRDLADLIYTNFPGRSIKVDVFN